MNLIPEKLKSPACLRKGLFCMGCLALLANPQVAWSTSPQLDSLTPSITLHLKNTTVKEVIAEIENQGDFYFTYSTNHVNVNRKVSIDVKNNSVEKVLDQLFANEGIGYSIEDNHIVLYKQSQETQVASVKQEKRKISGVISDKNGPIIGASIIEKGTTNGTITDFDGKFNLEVAPGTVLKISYVGYITQLVKVGTQKTFQIELKEDTKALEEVVVIGYGTQKKSDVSGSVTTVSGQKLTQLPTSSAEAALQGMAPGLSVNFGSGAPGTAASLQVRGITTWGTENTPLVIIDGVPGDMSYLNPEDIKSMSVLKDAATAAIYGARAAAGVIVIETHRGGIQEPKIQFSAYVGMDDLPKRLDVCNSAEFIKVRKMALSNAGYAPSEWPRYIAAYEKDPSQFADTDWQDEYYRRAFTQKYTLGYTAGNEIMNMSFSGFYSQKDGIIVGTDESKYGFRLNSDVKRGRFKMGESLSYSRWEATPEADTGFPGMFQTTNIEPLVHVYDENNEGGFGGAIPGMDMSDAANPVAFNELIRRKSANDYLSVSGYLQYEPIKNLFLKFRASRNIYWSSYRSFTPTYEVGILKVNKQASLYEERSKTMNDLLEFTANYDFSLNDAHHFQVLAGVSQEEKRFEDLSASGKKFENNDMDLMGQAQTDFSVGGSKTRSGLRSVFGRLNYNYKYRYMLMASFRYDGSSRFADGNKWGFFPSVSLGWNIANENFWERYKDFVSTFKLRVSYGGLGNQSVGLYKYIPQLNYDNASLNYPINGKDVNLGYGISSLPSANIKWETTIYKNIGIDLGLWNNKLELSLEGYIKDTKDMLSTKDISLCTGFGSLVVNDGKLRTTGFELQAIYHGSVGDFKYDVDMNVSHFKSVLKAMANPDYLDWNGPAKFYVGGELGEYWVTQTAGIFQSQAEVDQWNKEHGRKDANGNWIPLQPSAKPGDLRFIDQNGDGLLDNEDRVKVGAGNPKATMGLNLNLSYKNFDLLANFFGSFGSKRYNYAKMQLQRMDKNFNYGKDALRAWTPENPNTNIPRAVQGDPNKNNRVSDRYVENGDYLRLNNLQLGYNLPSTVCAQLGIANLRVYVGATRLFTLTSYDGYDPAVGEMGLDDGLYPLSRSYMLGLKFGF